MLIRAGTRDTVRATVAPRLPGRETRFYRQGRDDDRPPGPEDDRRPSATRRLARPSHPGRRRRPSPSGAGAARSATGSPRRAGENGVDVPDVELDAFGPAELVPAVDLGPAGRPRGALEAARWKSVYCSTW